MNSLANAAFSQSLPAKPIDNNVRFWALAQRTQTTKIGAQSGQAAGT